MAHHEMQKEMLPELAGAFMERQRCADFSGLFGTVVVGVVFGFVVGDAAGDAGALIRDYFQGPRFESRAGQKLSERKLTRSSIGSTMEFGQGLDVSGR